MDRLDFSDRFTTLLNSYAYPALQGEQSSKAEVVLDEYEKSVFLTKAQEELVISLYNGKNPYGESFEQTEELRRYLSNLVTDIELDAATGSNNRPLSSDGKHAFYTLPDGSGDNPAVWFITYERAEVSKGYCKGSEEAEETVTLDVVPVRQDEYHKVRKNPFRGANNRRVLRADLADGVVELISKFDIQKYYVRYLRKPKPILLEDLPEGMDIEGESEVSEPVCELHEALHQKILDLAVQMVLQSKGIAQRGNSESKDNK